MKKFQKILKTISILMVVGFMLVPASATFATGTDRPLTDRENAAFIVRDEWSAWVKGFTASLSELDKNATSRIYDNMDYYDMQYRFTEKYKKVPEYLDEDGKPTQKLKDLIKAKRKEIAGAKVRDYLCFTAKQNGTTIKYTLEGGLASSRVNIGYSRDGTSFVPWTVNTNITLNSGEELYVWNKTSLLSESDTKYVKFTMTGNVEASGSVDSMINFSDVSDYCYARLFEGCTALYTAPEVPSTSVRSHCYYKMFYGCTNLSTAPSSLPAATLALSCYESMFENCTSLKKSPNMMPKTIVDVSNALQRMFYGCSVLEEIDIEYYKGSFNAAFNNWVNGVAPSGTIYYKGPDTTEGPSAIPTGWLLINNDRDYLTFTAAEEGASVYYTIGSSLTDNIYYQISGDPDWTKWSGGVANKVTLVKDQSIRVWNRNSTLSTGTTDSTNRFRFFMPDGKIKASGSIESMINFNSTLSSYCFNYMFGQCTNLLTPPKLPSMSLADHCYYDMFHNCNQMIDVPELPATTMQEYCYTAMFYDCKSITTVPALPAQTMRMSCYSEMFTGCEGLVRVPQDLCSSATALAAYCYNKMFKGCKNLTTVPDLPCMTLVHHCYTSMFEGCTSLVTAQATLPATALKSQCYMYMFKGCTNLTKSPVLCGTSFGTSETDCCQEMFNGCTSLNEITINYTGEINDTQFKDWVVGVADEGMFYYSGTYATYGSSNIPKEDSHKWAVFAPGDNFILTAKENGSTVKFVAYAMGAYTPSGVQLDEIYYKKNNGSWAKWNENTVINMNNRDIIAIRNKRTTLGCLVGGGTTHAEGMNFVMTGQFEASGSIGALVNHANLSMLCFNNLFRGCGSLIKAPDLPATTLAQACYMNMFTNCTGLEKAPRLPATSLADDCYVEMFKGCTSLNEMKIDYTGALGGGQFTDWVDGVTSSGTFYYNNSTYNTKGNSAIPTNFTKQSFTP